MPTRGLITRAARSRRSLPVIWRKRRKDLKELQIVAAVRLDMCVNSCATNASKSMTVARLAAFLRDRKKERNTFAVSVSRRRVPFVVPLWN
jgi:hypothetical protein